jgi:protocatechuate 3,4-dioxygenase, beta subunit
MSDPPARPHTPGEPTSDQGHFWPVPAGAHPDAAASTFGPAERRLPRHPPVATPPTLERSGPRFPSSHHQATADLTRFAGAAAPPAIGQRILVAGRVTDERGQPVSGAMIEVWQANAAGRYHPPAEEQDVLLFPALDAALHAPLDPHFRGAGRVFTDDDGAYRFLTIKPGAYPCLERPGTWRPSHLHVSIAGPVWAARLVTQLYFEGDPLLAQDPFYQALGDEEARRRLVATLVALHDAPEHALGYRFDVVLRGLFATPFEAAERGGGGR